MWHIFFIVKSTSHETNGARQNRLDGRQKWLEPTWIVQVDLKSTSQVDSQVWILLTDEHLKYDVTYGLHECVMTPLAKRPEIVGHLMMKMSELCKLWVQV